MHYRHVARCTGRCHRTAGIPSWALSVLWRSGVTRGRVSSDIPEPPPSTPPVQPCSVRVRKRGGAQRGSNWPKQIGHAVRPSRERTSTGVVVARVRAPTLPWVLPRPRTPQDPAQVGFEAAMTRLLATIPQPCPTNCSGATRHIRGSQSLSHHPRYSLSVFDQYPEPALRDRVEGAPMYPLFTETVGIGV